MSINPPPDQNLSIFNPIDYLSSSTDGITREFADKWQEFPSPMLMAKEIKFTPRAIQNRRRSVEIKLGIKL